MKIVSVNKKHTVSPNEVAFHLDIYPSEYAIEKIPTEGFYGTLVVTFNNNLLHIKTTPNDKPLEVETIKNFNSKLKEIQQEEEQMKRRHDDMIARVAKLTELPIG